jgi:DNA topoisomerase VI subunit B
MRSASSGQSGRRPMYSLNEYFSLDACEEARIAPKLAITIDSAMGIIRVADNGPPETVTSILDFTTRTPSREAYASPTRGAQGNALRCIALP